MSVWWEALAKIWTGIDAVQIDPADSSAEAGFGCCVARRRSTNFLHEYEHAREVADTLERRAGVENYGRGLSPSPSKHIIEQYEDDDKAHFVPFVPATHTILAPVPVPVKATAASSEEEDVLILPCTGSGSMAQLLNELPPEAEFGDIDAMYNGNGDSKSDEDMAVNILDVRTRISQGDSDSLMVMPGAVDATPVRAVPPSSIERWTPSPSPQQAAMAYLREREAYMSLDLPDDDDDDDVRIGHIGAADLLPAPAPAPAAPAPPAPPAVGSAPPRRRSLVAAILPNRLTVGSEQRNAKRRMRAYVSSYETAHGRRPCTRDEWGEHWAAFQLAHKKHDKKQTRPRTYGAGLDSEHGRPPTQKKQLALKAVGQHREPPAGRSERHGSPAPAPAAPSTPTRAARSKRAHSLEPPSPADEVNNPSSPKGDGAPTARELESWSREVLRIERTMRASSRRKAREGGADGAAPPHSMWKLVRTNSWERWRSRGRLHPGK